MALTADDLQDLAKLFLEKRLGEQQLDLAACQAQVEQEIREQNLTPGPMVRGRLVSAWIRAYERHCEQVLVDLLGLMRSFAAVAAAEPIRVMLEQHLEAAADGLISSLADSGFGGVSSVSSEQKRITNTVAGIRHRLRQRWQEEMARVERESRRAGSLQSSAEDLDDRLPLNRRGIFDRDLATLARTAAGGDEPLALLMLDIDHFKRVNDEHGHPVGDEVLLEVAQRVVARVAHKGKCYRYGGEELAVLLPCYSAEEAVGMAERLRKDLESAPLSSRRLAVTASFGVACLPDQATGAKGLLEQADTALYAAKHGGRNQVRSAADL